ncbi:hypothetical protein FB451DRAFT_1182922 [Mycena latifolia]|nr:hypothetical protein FB451DRAFT_1182922 [Mycena latifolia]
MSLPKLLTDRYSRIQHRLIADGFLTDAQLATARKLLGSNPTREEHPPPFLHALAQPFPLNLARTARLCILSPHGVLRPALFARLAHSGTALVRFDHPEHADEGVLYLRVFHVLAPAAYLPRWAHLPPLAEGGLFPALFDPTLPWTWAYDARQAPADFGGAPLSFPPPRTFPVPGRGSLAARSNCSRTVHHRIAYISRRWPSDPSEVGTIHIHLFTHSSAIRIMVSSVHSFLGELMINDEDPTAGRAPRFHSALPTSTASTGANPPSFHLGPALCVRALSRALTEAAILWI